MAEMSAGRAVVELLKVEQVRHIFGIVGSTFLDVLDVLYDDKSVEYINVRHEQGAAFMADGFARASGVPAACLVTAGPGATNQKHFYNERYVGADIGNPRFDRLAELFGARGYYVEHADQIGDVVRAALTCGKPAVIEIPIDPNEFPVPATSARRRA